MTDVPFAPPCGQQLDFGFALKGQHLWTTPPGSNGVGALALGNTSALEGKYSFITYHLGQKSFLMVGRAKIGNTLYKVYLELKNKIASVQPGNSM